MWEKGHQIKLTSASLLKAGLASELAEAELPGVKEAEGCLSGVSPWAVWTGKVSSEVLRC